MSRSIENGKLRIEHVNQEVTVLGWVAKRRNFGSIVFVDLRDRTGIVQCVINQENLPLIDEVRSEYILEISGRVLERKDKNPKLATGDIEIEAKSLKIINTSKTTPLIIADETDALEETRLKYRYLDLRRPVMQEKLMIRSKITKAMRDTLDALDFIEIETPMLTKSSPEGAREYLVPSRIHEGEFYALAQSPQIYKQLLMVAGLERYYQVARCFRDEDLRADRQLDFTQFDFEMSFVNEDEILAVGEKIVENVMRNVMGQEVQMPIERITYHDAFDKYGCDKPDMRFELLLQDLTEIFEHSEFKAFQSVLENKGVIKAVVAPYADHFSRKEQDVITEYAKKYGAKGVVILKFIEGQLSGSAAKFLSETEQHQVIEYLSLKENDIIFIVADQYKVVSATLSAIRLNLRDRFNLARADDFKYCWVVDFPLFDYDEEEQRLVAAHHPFTMPKPEHVSLLDSEPLKVISSAYDLVLNGYELVSGSLRIHDQAIQKKVFEVVGFSEEEIKERFGFFVDAFQYGAPPHAGMAFGLDRLAMLLTKSESIRDVIAFPKVASARDLMSDAPAPATPKQLEELHLVIQKKKD